MALMTARRLVVRRRPPGRAAGRIGATSAQASSFKSVSYNSSVFSTDQRYTEGTNFSNTLLFLRTTRVFDEFLDRTSISTPTLLTFMARPSSDLFIILYDDLRKTQALFPPLRVAWSSGYFGQPGNQR